MNIISYNELRKISPEKIRELIRKVFESNNKNVLKTAKILEYQDILLEELYMAH